MYIYWKPSKISSELKEPWPKHHQPNKYGYVLNESRTCCKAREKRGYFALNKYKRLLICKEKYKTPRYKEVTWQQWSPRFRYFLQCRGF